MRPLPESLPSEPIPRNEECGKKNAPGLEFMYLDWFCRRPLEHGGHCSPFPCLVHDPEPVVVSR